jgi:hypothetical protein
MLSSSPDRGSFQINAQLERIQTGEATAEESQSMIEFYQSLIDNINLKKLPQILPIVIYNKID